MPVAKSFTIALDIEGTLISNAISQFPRPGLFHFLEDCRALGNVVFFTSVPPRKVEEIIGTLVSEGAAPPWVRDCPVVPWSGTGCKDLRLVSPNGISHSVLVDDVEENACAGQRNRLVLVEQFDPRTTGDLELQNALEKIREAAT
jgi:hypothetical protein